MQNNLIVRPARQSDEPGRTSKYNLPAQLTPLIGREHEVAAICSLLYLPHVRLVTLTGTGGIGKTRLAIAVAYQIQHHFDKGVCFVAFASIHDHKLAISTIAHELGIPEIGTQPLLETVKAFLRDKQLLLILDNFEQIITAAPLLEELLEACHQLTILVTSREVLHLQAENLFPVPSLGLPDLADLPESQELASYAAIALFLQRAQAITTDFQLTPNNAQAIAEICVRLDGLPLALELAAARIRLLPPQALLSRLSQRLDVLKGGWRSMPERQQTLRSTISWSYDLLNVAEQRLFRRLSIFVDGCTLEALEAVYTALDGIDAGAVLDGVASLINKSLLQQYELEGEPRLRFMEIIREYGLEILASSGEAEIMRQAHAAYYLALAEQAESELESPNQTAWLEQLETEHDNLRAALTWFMEQGANESALRLTVGIGRFLMVHGYVSEGRRWLEEGLEGGVDVFTSVRAKALNGAGGFAMMQGDISQAEALCRESLELCQELGERRVRAQSLSLLGYAAWLRSSYASARAMEEEALAIFQEVGDATGTAFVLQNLASMLALQGEFGRAQALLEESLTLSRRGCDVWNTTLSLLFLGWVSLCQGDYAGARTLLEESLEIPIAMGNMWIITIGLVGLATIAASQGELIRAVWLMSAAEAVRELIGALLPPFVHIMHESTIAATSEQLGELTFTKAWTEGRFMTLEQVLAAKDPLPRHAQLPKGLSSVEPPKSSPGYPAGLTAREVEVLSLVAQGMTDAQVAQQLVISPRTVNWHLTTIYSKLQVTSRSAATCYALQHQLL